MDKEQEFNIEIEKMSAINKINLEICKRLEQYKNGNEYSCNIVHKIVLNKDILFFEFICEEIKTQKLDQYFKNVNNLFNDQLPNTEYIDL